ncbi:glycoside hydrolase family 99-like domain-containing protein [Sphingobium xenophagum]|uniref:glycoside hydrolase family 99-like domain-containing protein n=1 Tax=Sphingobium xenophagum TaxID=121428 RepID=UPI00142D2184|nr:glycoside hydrolase family 99-like domain-containing protein [Sphingobium xenophagum]
MANENWSRNWDGQNRHVLMKQDYSLESNIALMRELIPMMKDRAGSVTTASPSCWSIASRSFPTGWKRRESGARNAGGGLG